MAQADFDAGIRDAVGHGSRPCGLADRVLEDGQRVNRRTANVDPPKMCSPSWVMWNAEAVKNYLVAWLVGQEDISVTLLN